MKRRDFLMNGFALAASPLLGADAPSNRVRVAIMGCRRNGRGFADMCSAMAVPGLEIACVCDVDSRAMDQAAAYVEKASGRMPKKEKDLRKVLEDKDIDGVICATPDHWHAPAAWMTMRAGKSIYVEKPCSYSAHEALVLAETAAETGVTFQMGNQRRSSRAYQEGVAAIRAGEIGEPRYARCWYSTSRGPIGRGKVVPVPEWLDWDLWQGPAPRRPFCNNIVHYTWHWHRHWGTGECGNNATHFVDVARWALGVDRPTRITSGGGRFFYKNDDWAWPDTQMVTYEFANRAFITWEGLSCTRLRPIEEAGTGAMIFGLKGAAFFTPYDWSVKFYDAKNVFTHEIKDDEAATSFDATANRTGGGSRDIPHFQNWADCIRARSQKTFSPADEAVKSSILTNYGNIAQLTGETLRIDPATGKIAGRNPAAENLWTREYEKGWEM